MGLLSAALRFLLEAVVGLVKLVVLAYCCLRAYRIRMHAVNTYGYLIHEFDPWFNYRATEYLAQHGWWHFFRWYDHMSWYPIGRPVGTTIYPGMQFAALWIWQAMSYIPEAKIDFIPKEIRSQVPAVLINWLPNKGKVLTFGPMSLNDVCCLVPAWFGSLATLFVYLLATEISGSTGAGVFAAYIMAIIPAHMMRSIAGGFDNEAVAISTFCCTLWLWCRCLRTKSSWPIGIFAGIAYAAAAATWGGYIFINNLIGLHAAVIVALGKFNSSTHRAFSLYYLVGTVGAMYVPVIGWAPLRALEQMPSLLVFGGYQVLELCDMYRRRKSKAMTGFQFFMFRVMVFTVIASIAGAVAYVLLLNGVFMPLGARIRGLFLEAVKTGNPLVDSVAEHQPANDQAYNMYLGEARFVAVAGLLFCWHQFSPSKFLAVLYAAVAYKYSMKMSRLILICGPIVSVLAGFPMGIMLDWCLEQVIGLLCGPRRAAEDSWAMMPARSGGMGSIGRTLWSWVGSSIYPAELHDMLSAKDKLSTRAPVVDRLLRLLLAAAVFVLGAPRVGVFLTDFASHADSMAPRMGNPHLAFKTTLRNGEAVIVDDYVKGYRWIKDNTPDDSRVMAWWDYGYQITGISNRTSIADGNTWNHEHIATLGRILTSPEKRAHNAMRHLTDYVLVWAGGRGDDMGKSPHLARIGNSVFPDHCGDDDPMCSKFGFFQGGNPTPMMEKSFLYKAVNHQVKDNVKLNGKLFKEVHTTKYGLMRVYQVLNVSQESKDWVANPANRVCDAPGSWYCVGQYPPAIQPLIEKRRNFAQLEDFNKLDGKSEKSAYTKHIEAQRAAQR